MHPSFGEVEFLAGSPNRIAVLEAVTAEPRTRDELKTLTGLSRVALSRALSDLEDRDWLVRASHHYETTPLGAVVAAEFTTLLDNLDAAAELEAVLGWLPTGEFGFDLRRLQGATVTTSTESDHTASIRYAVDIIREAERFRVVATGVAYEIIEALHERTVGESRPIELVLDASAFDYLRDDAELGPPFQEVLAAEGSEVFQYEGGDRLAMLTITEAFVSLRGYESAAAIEHVRTPDSAVRSWAETYFETVREASERVTAEMFADRTRLE